MNLNIPKGVDTFVFDLGEVIVDLDVMSVLNGFASRTSIDVSDIKSLIVGNESLFLYETGQMSTDDFYLEVKAALQLNMEKSEFVVVWNSMLSQIDPLKLDLLQAVSQKAQTLILSNTNEMHEVAFDQMVDRIKPGKRMHDFVHHAYYSHRIGLRKPNKEIYDYILEHHQLDPSKTMFFDDKEENIAASKDVGIQGIQVQQPKDLYTYFR